MSQSSESPAKKLTDIFINYRRADTAGHAGRLEQDLSLRFPGRVFMDIHKIEPGADFVEAINREVGRCGALIVLIGDQWLEITDPNTGKRRLDNPDDYVALEIAAALKRDIRVIPVLVEGAKMPTAESLPAALAGLVRRNALEISDTRWNYDVQQLVKILEKVCGVAPPVGESKIGTAKERISEAAAPGRRTAKIAIVSAVVTLLVMGAMLMYLRSGSGEKPPPPTTNTVPVSPTPQVTAIATVTPVPIDPTTQPEISDEEGEVRVNLQAQDGPKAKFVFPFETKGNDWPLEDVEGDQYFWRVEVDGGADKYNLEFSLSKNKSERLKKQKGVLEAILDNAKRYGVWSVWQGGTNDEWAKQSEMKFFYTVLPQGLEITVQNDDVKTIFANQPNKARLSLKTPKSDYGKVFRRAGIKYGELYSR